MRRVLLAIPSRVVRLVLVQSDCVAMINLLVRRRRRRPSAVSLLCHFQDHFKFDWRAQR